MSWLHPQTHSSPAGDASKSTTRYMYASTVSSRFMLSVSPSCHFPFVSAFVHLVFFKYDGSPLTLISGMVKMSLLWRQIAKAKRANKRNPRVGSDTRAKVSKSELFEAKEGSQPLPCPPRTNLDHSSFLSSSPRPARFAHTIILASESNSSIRFIRIPSGQCPSKAKERPAPEISLTFACVAVRIWPLTDGVGSIRVIFWNQNLTWLAPGTNN